MRLFSFDFWQFIERHIEIKALAAVPLFVWGCYAYFAPNKWEGSLDWLPIVAISAHYLLLTVVLKALYSMHFQMSYQPARRGTGFNYRRSIRAFLYHRRRFVWKRSLGDTIDFFIIQVSLLTSSMYVVETYSPVLVAKVWWQVIEFIVSMVLCADHIFRLFVAIDPLVYLLSSQGVIDSVTSVPIILYVLHRWFSDRVEGLFYRSSLSYLRLLRLAKLLRILKGFNLITSGSSDSLRSELVRLVFTVVCMIFTAAGVYHWLENPADCADIAIIDVFKDSRYHGGDGTGECIYFHGALYYSTIAVLGRPRLIMEQEWTRCMVIGLTALSVLVIPPKVAGVLQVMQRTNKYQRLTYKPRSWWRKHLVIVGHKEFAAINMFLYEFFHTSRGHHSVKDLVLLFAGPPNSDIEALLCDPAHGGNITYIQGTPLQEKDLERACLSEAAGVIVVANKDTEHPSWHDGELVTCIQAMKAYWLKEVVRRTHGEIEIAGSRHAASLLRPRIVAQVMLPQTKMYLEALPGWTENDIIIVCSTYISSMLSMATLAQGMATLLFNCVSHIDKLPQHRTKWYRRYEAGASQEIYASTVDEEFEGREMADMASLLAKQGCALIGVKRATEVPEEPHIHLFPGPRNFRFQKGDRIFCLAASARRLRSVMTSLSGRQRLVSKASLFDTGGVESSLLKKMEAPRRTPTEVINTMQDEVHEQVQEFLLDRSVSQQMAPMLSVGGQSAITAALFCGNALHPLSRPSVIDTRWLSASEIVEALRQRDPPWMDHVVVLGLPFRHPDYLTTGRGAVTTFLHLVLDVEVNERLGKPHGIVVVDPDVEQHLQTLCMSDKFLMQMVVQRRIRAIAGDPRNHDALISDACIVDARAIVSLPEDMDAASRRQLVSVEGDIACLRDKMVKQIVDTNTVLTMQIARSQASDLLSMSRPELVRGKSLVASNDSSHNCVTLLLQEGTTSLFFGHAHMRHVGVKQADWDITPLNMSPLFAAGELFATTCCDRLLAEAFFNKYLLVLITMLFHGDARGNRLRQAACPTEHVGRSYGEVLQDMLIDGQMLVGIVRVPDPDGSGVTFFPGEPCPDPDLPDTHLPYVVTNPGPGEIILQEQDLLFILGRTGDGAASRSWTVSSCSGAAAFPRGDGRGTHGGTSRGSAQQSEAPSVHEDNDRSTEILSA